MIGVTGLARKNLLLLLVLQSKALGHPSPSGGWPMIQRPRVSETPPPLGEGFRGRR